MANRSQPGTERIIGPVGNTALIRTRLDADLTFQDAVGRVRDSVLDAYAMQDLPFDILGARLAEEEGIDPARLMRASFVLQNAFRRPLEVADVGVKPFTRGHVETPAAIDRTWLRMSLKETPSGIAGTCGCKRELFAPHDLHPWGADYATILAKAAADPAISLGRLVEL
jgi:non-ribosomal peptide synthetase component F